LITPKAAAPTPCKVRSTKSRPKSVARAQATPATPKRKRDGTRTLRRLYRSERTPATGVNRMPGSVKTVIRSPTCPDEMPSASRISGKAGVMLEVPSTAINVIPKIT
jgi:hypothetical protein